MKRSNSKEYRKLLNKPEENPKKAFNPEMAIPMLKYADCSTIFYLFILKRFLSIG